MSLNIYIPKRRKLAPEDNFFVEGNLEARGYWLTKHARIPDNEVQRTVAQLSKEASLTLACHTSPCTGRIIYPNNAAYEAHYEATHKHVCHDCSKTFPSSRWLELHIEERHDSIFKIRLERGEKLYRCFVMGCERKFSEPRKRKLHLIEKHKYPKSFNFRIVQTGLAKRWKSSKSTKQTDPMDIVRNSEKSPIKHDTRIDDSDEMDVVELTSSMNKLRIPKNISFGRGARTGGWFGRGGGFTGSHTKKA
ncbi:hypothetical protein K7432_006435 [Basidiobolus ranarum]|uniref:C2H2-type domain-containing protein n=1 Tax=Basidiobolus ranarum TaxID=34480 RepID=A0ABR2WUW4_9FUNG